MTRLINHLGSTTERLKAQNNLPKKLLAYQTKNSQLTDLFRQTLGEITTQEMATFCQVVRYADGQLIVATSNATLVNHLRYLSQTLKETLKQHHPVFCDLHNIEVAMV